ncbi:TRAP transporter substrate-binding protein [Aquamicrobium defluvii]|uniref:TRAP-type C4-dicarboxylate transport system substrate-binding protein n=1 Tax=Aquamicrobium defluvii TaxID=69279 RepID=A0A011SWT5_9HYPH|nr:TRAP transporter substrate-binding protein DctP [Aquamicrobium defluvii]EXL03729.1 hypothetical protein BG36_11400 [Aquamicrobium defluvii]EZQ15298.1 hypothetical protein CF98_12800 [Halopseudomonas bauzanensis]TDR32106.1 TRAP-type C4-dicarboxylate transport system substrate-binding protein [Aquamicrobium defluvii]
MLKIRSIVGGAALAGLLAATPAVGQEAWKLGQVGAPGSGLAVMGDKFATAVTEASGGAFTVERQFIGNEQEMVQQVLRGRVEMGVTSPQGMGVAIPAGTVLGLPFLWKSDEERDFVVQTKVKPVLEAIYEKAGLKLLQISSAGYYGVFCKVDCSDPATLKQQKVRVSATVPSRVFWENQQVNPVQLPVSELWPGLEQNLVVAADIPLPYYVTTPAVESAPHFVAAKHFHADWIYFMNLRKWNGLSDEQRTAIQEKIPTSQELTAFYDSEVEKARRQLVDEFKGHYYELNDEQRAKWHNNIETKYPEILASMTEEARSLYEVIVAAKKEFAVR